MADSLVHILQKCFFFFFFSKGIRFSRKKDKKKGRFGQFEEERDRKEARETDHWLNLKFYYIYRKMKRNIRRIFI